VKKNFVYFFWFLNIILSVVLSAVNQSALLPYANGMIILWFIMSFIMPDVTCLIKGKTEE
jgi:hypothetical protein